MASDDQSRLNTSCLPMLFHFDNLSWDCHPKLFGKGTKRASANNKLTVFSTAECKKLYVRAFSYPL